MTAISIGTYSISRQKLISISGRAERGEIETPLAERAWDKVVDFFCGSHREEAKLCLATLYSSRATEQQRLDAFSRLKALAGEAYQHEFRESLNGVYRQYTFLPDDPSLRCALCRTNVLCGWDASRGHMVLKELEELRTSCLWGGFGNIALDDYVGMADRVETALIPPARWSQFKAQAQAALNAEETTSVYFLNDQRVYAAVRNVIDQCVSNDFDVRDFKLRHLDVYVRRSEQGTLHCMLRGVEFDPGGEDQLAHPSDAMGVEKPSGRLDVLIWVTVDTHGRISAPLAEAWTQTSARDLVLMKDVFDRM
ncbi:MAG TPA: hypothetical protein VL424_21275 [Pararobbsia sp.]|jgi:hypothetical protein|nr:hypothetical protein [Pararobbsia sp.]